MIAGIAFAVLFAAALLMVPTLPGIDKPGYDIVSHVNEHSGAMRMQALLVTFGSLALVVVLGYARDRLTGPPAYVFTIGSAVALVEVFIAMWFTAGLALHPDQLGSATVRTITDIAAMWGPILTVADIMVAVPILLAANDDRFPRWLGMVAAVFAVEQLIETITIIGPPASFISPGGTMNFYLGGPLFIILLALGVALSLQQPVEDRSVTSTNRPPDTGAGQTAPSSSLSPVGSVDDSLTSGQLASPATKRSPRGSEGCSRYPSRLSRCRGVRLSGWPSVELGRRAYRLVVAGEVSVRPVWTAGMNPPGVSSAAPTFNASTIATSSA